MSAIQANQFIGSRISLVSKAEIRYEGILYSLDLNEATISLAKVKSYGTEDRPTDRPIPPKDEVYEFIIFRGADIKSIDVVEPPKSATALASGLSEDPAIVQVSNYHSGPSGVSSNNSYSSRNNSSVLNTLFGGRSSPNKRRNDNSGNNYDGQNQRNGRSRSRGRNNNNNNNNNRPRQNSNNNNNNNSGRGGRGGGRGRVDQQRQFGGGGGRGMRNVYDNGSYFHNPYQQQAFGFGPPPRRGGGMFVNRNFRGGRGRGGFGGNRNNGNNRQQQQGRGIIEAQQPAKVTFEEEFDFEKSHEELITALNKMNLEKEKGDNKDGDEQKDGDGNKETNEDGGSPKAAEENVVYYAKDNFFDNISCEALKKKDKNSRPDRRAEMKLNAETFGVSEKNGNGGNNNGNRRRNYSPMRFFDPRGYNYNGPPNYYGPRYYQPRYYTPRYPQSNFY